MIIDRGQIFHVNHIKLGVVDFIVIVGNHQGIMFVVVLDSLLKGQGLIFKTYSFFLLKLINLAATSSYYDVTLLVLLKVLIYLSTLTKNSRFF